MATPEEKKRLRSTFPGGISADPGYDVGGGRALGEQLGKVSQTLPGTDYMRDAASEARKALGGGGASGVGRMIGTGVRGAIGAPLAVADDAFVKPLTPPVKAVGKGIAYAGGTALDAGVGFAKGLFDIKDDLPKPLAAPRVGIPAAQPMVGDWAEQEAAARARASQSQVEFGRQPLPSAGNGPVALGDGGSNVNYIKSGDRGVYFSPNGNVIRQGFERGGESPFPRQEPAEPGSREFAEQQRQDALRNDRGGLTITQDGKTEFAPSSRTYSELREPTYSRATDPNYVELSASERKGGAAFVRRGGPDDPEAKASALIRPTNLTNRAISDWNQNMTARDQNKSASGLGRDRLGLDRDRLGYDKESSERTAAETARQNLVTGRHYENQDANQSRLTDSTIATQGITGQTAQLGLDRERQNNALLKEYERATPERKAQIADYLRTQDGKGAAKYQIVTREELGPDGLTMIKTPYAIDPNNPANATEIGGRSAAQQLPPTKDRVKGQSYNLPQGRFKWTGKDWVKE